jgi:hypothetical protein
MRDGSEMKRKKIVCGKGLVWRSAAFTVEETRELRRRRWI